MLFDEHLGERVPLQYTMLPSDLGLRSELKGFRLFLCEEAYYLIKTFASTMVKEEPKDDFNISDDAPEPPNKRLKLSEDVL